MQGGITVAASQEATLQAFGNEEFRQLVTPAVILAVCLICGKCFRDNRLSVPGILLLSLLIFYGMLYFSGISREEADADGLLPLIESTGSLVPIFHFD